MLLYEPEDYKKLTITYKLAVESSDLSKAKLGVTDNYSTNSLAKVIGGGISSYHELNAAEQCLRALIFHDQVIRQAPCVKINNMFTQALDLNKPHHDLNTYIGNDIIKQHIGTINHLLGFQDESQAKDEVLKRATLASDEQAREAKLGFKPSFKFSPSSCTIQKVADSLEDYAEAHFKQNRTLQSRFILPIEKSKLPSYISYPFLLNHFYQDSFNFDRNGYGANEFFNTLDEVWNQYTSKLRSRVELQMPVFLSIVIDRAASREDIPNVILDLREEYEESRSSLWSIYDECDDPSMSDHNIISRLNDVEHSTREVLHRMLLPNTKTQSTLCLQNRQKIVSILTCLIVLFESGSPIAELLALTSTLFASLSVGDTFTMQEARLTAHNIKEMEHAKLLTKFFDEQELAAINRKTEF